MRVRAVETIAGAKETTVVPAARTVRRVRPRTAGRAIATVVATIVRPACARRENLRQRSPLPVAVSVRAVVPRSAPNGSRGSVSDRRARVRPKAARVLPKEVLPVRVPKSLREKTAAAEGITVGAKEITAVPAVRTAPRVRREMVPARRPVGKRSNGLLFSGSCVGIRSFGERGQGGSVRPAAVAGRR